MKGSFAVAIFAMLCAASFCVNAETEPAHHSETALQVQSWCKPIVNAELGADDMIYYAQTIDTGFCWGAFAAIQDLSIIAWDNLTPLLGFCPPPTSSRLQYIKVFSKYVDDHPEEGNQQFAGIARRALSSAFPCPSKN